MLAGLNLIQSYTLNLTQAEAYFEEERIFLRLLQRDAAHETINERNYIYFTPPDTELQLVYAIQQAYLLPPSPAQIIHIPLEELPEFSTYMIHLLRDENTVAILSPGLEESLRWELERELVSYGKEPCVVQRTPLSAPAFTIFTFEKRPLLCPEAGQLGSGPMNTPRTSRTLRTVLPDCAGLPRRRGSGTLPPMLAAKNTAS